MYQNETIRKRIEQDGGDGVQRKSNLFDALTYAVKLPFRSGVSKSIVLVTCSHCRLTSWKDGVIGNDDDGSGNYGDALTMLVENNIQLNILTTERLQLISER